MLPFSLCQAIDKLLGSHNFSEIRQARRTLTQYYRAENNHRFIKDDAARLSYLATRMPATYAVCRVVLAHLSKETHQITSLLDLGAGPATVLWVVQDVFPSLKHITLIERDRRLSEFGAALFDDRLEQKQITWIKSEFSAAIPFRPHKLVTLSYVLGELSMKDQKEIISAAWKATQAFFVLIEPGTPQGFERIKQARRQLIENGAFIAAPCPHQSVCPMTGKDWCHFSKRLERTSLHRSLKEASLAYEDEKYSYIIAARDPLTHPSSRIVRKAKQGSGHFILDLCAQDGLKRLIISRKAGELYRTARRLEWGDPGPDNEQNT